MNCAIIVPYFLITFRKKDHDLKQRVISAAVLIIAVAACFFLSEETRILFLALASVLAVWETCRAVDSIGVKTCPWVLYVYAAASAAAVYFGLDRIYTDALLFLAVFACMTVGICCESIRGRGALATLAVLAYPLFPFVLIMQLSLLEGRLWVPVFSIGCISTWICDSFALFGGMLLGKHHIAPYVSPHKTVEGCITGAVFSAIAGFVLWFFLRGEFGISAVCCTLTALIASTFGQIGDLAASLIKRTAGIKDYSNLIPGHGGVVDRTDSLLFSIPVTYFCLVLAGII